MRGCVDRLRDENRRLLQEKAENEQMLQLLETQRDVLTKSVRTDLGHDFSYSDLLNLPKF